MSYEDEGSYFIHFFCYFNTALQECKEGVGGNEMLLTSPNL